MTSSVATGAKPLLYGDFIAAFVIVDRLSTNLEMIPNLIEANGRSTGQRGAYLRFCIGSKVVHAAALRLLVTT